MSRTPSPSNDHPSRQESGVFEPLRMVSSQSTDSSADASGNEDMYKLLEPLFGMEVRYVAIAIKSGDAKRQGERIGDGCRLEVRESHLRDSAELLEALIQVVKKDGRVQFVALNLQDCANCFKFVSRMAEVESPLRGVQIFVTRALSDTREFRQLLSDSPQTVRSCVKQLPDTSRDSRWS